MRDEVPSRKCDASKEGRKFVSSNTYSILVNCDVVDALSFDTLSYVVVNIIR